MSLIDRLLAAIAPPPPPPSDHHAAALAAAGEILKVSTGLATGALVFSVGLLPNLTNASAPVRLTLTLTWVVLFLSVVAGVLAQSAIPVLMDEQRFDLEAPTFTWPGRIHQILFGLAILGLATVLIATLNAGPGHQAVPDARAALLAAERALPPNTTPDRIDLIELLPGPDPTRRTQSTWHVRLHFRPGATADLLIDLATGATLRVGP